MNNGMNISNMYNGGSGQKSQAGSSGNSKTATRPGDDQAPNVLGVVAVSSGDTDPGVSPFKKVYNEIAKCNTIAQSNNGAKNGTESGAAENAGSSDQGNLLASEVLSQLGAGNIIQTSGGNSDTDSSGTMVAQGAGLIQDAITAISKTLNLKTGDGLDALGSITPSKGLADQLAEMLSTLKGIAGVLDQSVKLNQPLEYKGVAVDVASAEDVQQVIHEQMFKIELAVKMMGISGEVAAAMSQKENSAGDAVATLSGIPQASDPSKLAMPAIHVKQVLGEALASKEQKVGTLLTKLADTLKTGGVPDAPATLTKSSAVVQAGLGKTSAPDIQDIAPLDSQVMRKILKVDGTQSTADENKTAAQQADGMAVSKDGQVLTSKSVVDAPASQKAIDTVVSAASETRFPGPMSRIRWQARFRTNETGSTRDLEESVIQQVAEKLNVAVKTGITEICVTLRPESLGDVQLKIKVDGDVAMGKMYVENQQVKHIVEANLQTLKDSLSQHNLSVGSFDVDVNHGNNARGQMQDLADANAQNGGGDGNSNKEGSDETETDSSSTTFASGIETGRKFGTNTIEFFA